MIGVRDRYLAAFAYHFGVRPWEWDLLTWADVQALTAAVEAMAKEQT